MLPGFGKLVKSERKAREGRNPATRRDDSDPGQDDVEVSRREINERYVLTTKMN